MIKKMIKETLKKIRFYMVYDDKIENQYRIELGKQGCFQNKVILVTGGSGAIGRAACIQFSLGGGIVYVAGTNQLKIDETIKIIKENGKDAFGVVMHVDDYTDVKRVVDGIIAEQGKIDILVNCAGGSAREQGTTLDRQDVDVIKRIIESNLFGTIYCCKCVLSIMKENRAGKIINVSSLLGMQGRKYHTEYSAAKAGIIAVTKSLAKEVGEFGINVNCVTPGLVQREKFDAGDAYNYCNTNYLNRVCKPTDVANLICFLSSDEADFITGGNYVIDGGRGLECRGDT